MELGSSIRRPQLASSQPSWRTYGDRFIPNRGAMNMQIAEALLFVPRKEESPDEVSPSRAAYRKILDDTLLQGRTRIFSFCNQPRTPIQSLPEPHFPTKIMPAKQRRHIAQSAEKIFDVPDIVGDDRFNLLDWGSKNLLSIALDDTVYICNTTNRCACKLTMVTEDYAPVTSVSWAADGRHIAVGCNNSTVDLYDATTNKLLRVITGLNQGPICSLAWNGHLLTTGGADGKIINNDVRTRSHIVSAYHGHVDAVSGLRWSLSGEQLASGGNDKLLHIWDISRSTSLYRFDNHTAAIRAVAWCPFKDNLLVSGGGVTDHCIKFWNVGAGTCMKSMDTGSQVCSLLWSKNEWELLSSHGHSTNQLTLWKYPSMEKMAELSGHTSPVLYTAQSPGGCLVASASEDEILKIWRISENSTKKNKPNTPHVFGPSNMNIR